MNQIRRFVTQFKHFRFASYGLLQRNMSSGDQMLSFDNYDAYGFDIDHTLAKYNLPNLFTDCYLIMARYLVKKKRYSEDILSFDPDFYMRGLVLDIPHGNFLKLAEDGTVLRASHGTRFLSSEELTELYGSNRHWEHFEELIESVNNIGERFWIFENFFDMAVGHLCARVVDSIDKKAGGKPLVYNYWSDAMDAANYIYHPKHFASGHGEFFPKFKDDTSHYVQQCSEEVKSWLKRLRQAGKKLFVVSSSYVDFATTSLKYILGDDWKSYFDVYVTLAKKPTFFSNGRQFLRLECDAEKEPVTELEAGQFYSQGNCTTLNTFLGKITGKENPKVLFFGDSMRSDVSPAKKYAGWDTVIVLEEMEAELDWLTCDDDDQTDNPLEPHKKKIKISNLPDAREKDFLTSRQWGSLFTDDHVVATCKPDGRKYMNTLWGYVIRKYADIAIPQLEYITELPFNHQFHVFDHEVARKWGFYPRIPRALQSDSNSVVNGV